jgi:hypothetical protein
LRRLLLVQADLLTLAAFAGSAAGRETALSLAKSYLSRPAAKAQSRPGGLPVAGYSPHPKLSRDSAFWFGETNCPQRRITTSVLLIIQRKILPTMYFLSLRRSIINSDDKSRKDS